MNVAPVTVTQVPLGWVVCSKLTAASHQHRPLFTMLLVYMGSTTIREKTLTSSKAAGAAD
jgi:hypothetical protein